MSCDHTCRGMYTDLRREIIKDTPEVDKRFKYSYVETASSVKTDPYHWVKYKNGNVMWEGSVCCKWAARFNALVKLSEEMK